MEQGLDLEQVWVQETVLERELGMVQVYFQCKSADMLEMQYKKPYSRDSRMYLLIHLLYFLEHK